MKDKIQRIINEKGLNPGTFADSIGLQRAILYHILNGRNKASLEVVIKIHSRYPEIDAGWLLSPDMPADTPYIYIGANETGANAESVAAGEYNTDGGDSKVAVQQELFPTAELSEVAENSEIRGVDGKQSENLNLRGVEIEHFQCKKPENQPVKSPKSVSEVILLYDDGTYKRLREC